MMTRTALTGLMAGAACNVGGPTPSQRQETDFFPVPGLPFRATNLVTGSAYAQSTCVQSGKCSPNFEQDNPGSPLGDLGLALVTYQDAAAYCESLGMNLATLQQSRDMAKAAHTPKHCASVSLIPTECLTAGLSVGVPNQLAQNRSYPNGARLKFDFTSGTFDVNHAETGAAGHWRCATYVDPVAAGIYFLAF